MFLIVIQYNSGIYKFEWKKCIFIFTSLELKYIFHLERKQLTTATFAASNTLALILKRDLWAFSKPPKWVGDVGACEHMHAQTYTHRHTHTHSLRIMEDSESTAERVQGNRPVL